MEIKDNKYSIDQEKYQQALYEIEITKEFAQKDFSDNVEINSQNAHLLNQQMLWLSTGILTIMFGTISTLLSNKSIINNVLFYISTYSLVITIILIFIKMGISLINYRNRLRVLDSQRKNGIILEEYKKNDNRCKITRCVIIILEIISYISFIGGIVCLSIFMNTNLKLFFS